MMGNRSWFSQGPSVSGHHGDTTIPKLEADLATANSILKLLIGQGAGVDVSRLGSRDGCPVFYNLPDAVLLTPTQRQHLQPLLAEADDG